ncbi:hypothetical protein Rhopal_004507-T1 [Rhodotorula paludigena]|uniref:Uncharacterized protein n=1 Tax=Rhodotorula paludigena TaxID=86838 RepID=A0AAV5GNH8_9BASI|nr:hypothetical protein Rhopal_004507-T1 [Rhodotorula paludigena]
MASLAAQELWIKAFDGDTTDPDALACQDELEVHLKRYPDDNNFVATRMPGTGYGSIVCMEDDCFKEINLEPNPYHQDGGVKRGFGWLERYWSHIEKDAAHKPSRDARIAKVRTPKAKTPRTGSQPSSATSSDAEGLRDRLGQVKKRAGQPYSPLASGSGLQANGASAALVPRKRVSEDVKPRKALPGIFSDDGDESVQDKKPKLYDAGAGTAATGVLADRPNDAQLGSPAQLTPAERSYSLKLKRQMEQWESVIADLDAQPLPRTPDWYKSHDQANAGLLAVKTPYEALKKRGDAAPPGLAGAIGTPKPKPQAPRPQLKPAIATPNNAIGAAATSAALTKNGFTCSATAPPAVKQHFEDYPQSASIAFPDWVKLDVGAAAGPSGAGGVAFPELAGKGDLTGATLDALSTFNTAARAGADDGSDDEDRMWGQLAPLRTEDFDHFVKKAIEGEGFEGNLNVLNAAQNIGLTNITDKVPHMTVKLLPHQIIACAWTKEQEAGKNYGGILGDEMGLGKTIEAIATCMLNESRDPEEKTTLVVAPLALLEQWRSELEEKVEPGYLSILTYHGPDRRKYKLKHLKRYDFVLTTYATLIADYDDDEMMEKKAKKMAKKNNEADAWEEYVETKEPGPLFQMSFYRVILDEAQNIRNRATKISRAVTRVDSLFRWALTGTPITNSLSDLFGIFRYLQLKPWYDWSYYREQVVRFEKRNPDIAGRKAQAILRSCMLRRKKDSKLDGKELISLPPKKIALHELTFSEEEREIYTFVETKAQAKFNKFLKAGTVMKNYAHVLVLLLRLRQVCFHPSLIADTEETLARKEEAKGKLKEELARAKKDVGADFVKKIRKARLDAAVERCQAERKGDDASAIDECSICMEDYNNTDGGGSVVRCTHMFCSACIVDVLNAPMAADHDEEGADKKCKADERPCPICRQPFGKKDLFPLDAFEPTDEEICTATGLDIDMDEDDDDDTLGGFIVADDEDDDAFADSVKKKKKPKQPNRAIVQDSDDEQSEAEEEPAPSRKEKGKGKKKEKTALELDWMAKQEPSTKMIWALTEIERSFKETPDDKIIVISSFTSALELFDRYLATKGIRTTRYQGDMKITEREDSIRVLKKSKKCKVMLRIGQEKDVFVHRLTIENTVEQRILEMQKKKQNLSDAATGEGAGMKMGKLTVADLAGLFGLNVRGQRI